MTTMRWFGKSWGAPMNEDCPQVPVPVGEICCHCDELIAENDRGVFYANGPIAHFECFIRATIGSVAHQLKTCSCYVPGADETDPPELTKREAARLAVELWEKNNGHYERPDSR